MTGDKVKDKKRLVYCLKCSNEFLSRVDEPRCSQCNSSRVVDHKDISSKKDVLDMRHRIDQIEADLTECEKKILDNEQKLEAVKELYYKPKKV